MKRTSPKKPKPRQGLPSVVVIHWFDACREGEYSTHGEADDWVGMFIAGFLVRENAYSYVVAMEAPDTSADEEIERYRNVMSIPKANVLSVLTINLEIHRDARGTASVMAS